MVLARKGLTYGVSFGFRDKTMIEQKSYLDVTTTLRYRINWEEPSSAHPPSFVVPSVETLAHSLGTIPGMGESNISIKDLHYPESN